MNSPCVAAPHRLAMLEDIATRPADASNGQIATFLEQSFDDDPERERDALQSWRGQVPSRTR